MKRARFEVRLDYLLTSHQEGWQINSLCNPAVDAVKPLFLALESSFIYMPVNNDELVAPHALSSLAPAYPARPSSSQLRFSTS
jgi:hypothetical protein